MTDETLRALLAYFPLMLLICSVEVRALRGTRKTWLERTLVFLGVLVTSLGLLGVFFELITRERNIPAPPDAVDLTVGIWFLAVMSTFVGVGIATSIASQWMETRD